MLPNFPMLLLAQAAKELVEGVRPEIAGCQVAGNPSVARQKVSDVPSGRTCSQRNRTEADTSYR